MVFVPLRDENPLRVIRWQWVTMGLIVVNTVIFALTVYFQNFSQADQSIAGSFATIPVELLNSGFGPARGRFDAIAVPEPLTLITYQFLHGSPLHLVGNMLFLWVFGDNVEDALGHVRFLIFYFLCAAAGAYAHGMVDPRSEMPLIGASGAIAGVVSAYLILHPRVRIWVLALMRIPLRLPAWIVLALWILFQFAMFAIGGEDQISWAAHIGGIVAGAVLVLVLRRRGVPLLDREIVTPAAVETTAQPVSRGSVPPAGPRWGRQ
jgi:membrane associated rhomboid family serine protease